MQLLRLRRGKSSATMKTRGARSWPHDEPGLPTRAALLLCISVWQKGVIRHRATEENWSRITRITRRQAGSSRSPCITSPTTYAVCDRRKFVEFVKFVAKYFWRQFFPQLPPEAESSRRFATETSYYSCRVSICRRNVFGLQAKA